MDRDDVPRSASTASDPPAAIPGDYPLLAGLYQLAYVVRDIDETVRRLADFGVRSIDVRRDLVRPGGSGTIRHSAKAWVGPIMLEIIEPFRDRPSLYDAPLTPGREAFLHHFGCQVRDASDWRRLSDTLARQALDVVVMRTLPDMLSFAYTDLRCEIGAFVEHVHLLDPSFYADVPHNAAGEGGAPQLLAGFFEIGFVTSDIEAAKALFRERFGVERWWDDDLARAGAGANPILARAVGDALGATVALVEPRLGVASPYAEGLSQEAVARLHHLSLHVGDAAELARTEAAAAQSGLAVTRLDEGTGQPAAIVDARRQLGHFLKYVVAGEVQRV